MPKKIIRCPGGNYTVVLDAAVNKIMISQRKFGHGRFYELPFDRIRAVVVRRKSVVPFAAITLLSGIATLILKYGGLWSLVNVSQETIGRSTVFGALFCAAFAIPSLSRFLFVDVSISWDGQPSSWLIRFVPAHCGKRLASTLLELSSDSLA